jgi:hypothetical protein
MMSQSRYIKWDLLERKERLQLRYCSGARKPLAHYTGEGWGFYGHSNSGLGGFFSLAMDSWLSQVNWFGLHLYWGEGDNLESILLISPVADLYLSFRCRNAGLHLLRM